MLPALRLGVLGQKDKQEGGCGCCALRARNASHRLLAQNIAALNYDPVWIEPTQFAAFEETVTAYGAVFTHLSNFALVVGCLAKDPPIFIDPPDRRGGLSGLAKDHALCVNEADFKFTMLGLLKNLTCYFV